MLLGLIENFILLLSPEDSGNRNSQAVFSECGKEAMNPGKGSHLRDME